MVYRATPHTTTGRSSPFELLHGRRLRTALENSVGQGDGVCDNSDIRQRVQREKQQKIKRYHGRRTSKPNINIGDPVCYRLMPRPRKGRPQFSEPCVVIAQRGPVSYELDGGIRVHAERLSLCRTSVRRSAGSRGGGELVKLDLLHDDLHDQHKERQQSADERADGVWEGASGGIEDDNRSGSSDGAAPEHAGLYRT